MTCHSPFFPLFFLSVLYCGALARPAEKFNDFDWALTKAVGREVDDNVVLSTVSVKLVLAMLYEGAGGQTARQLEAALGLAPRTRSYTTDKFSSVLSSLKEPSKNYELDIGTKLFVDKDAQVNPVYQDTLSARYNASMETVDFDKTTETVNQINSWASAVTKGHIQQLLNEADAKASTVMLLLNAVYFNGQWSYPFPRNQTKQAPFFRRNNRMIKADFMNATLTVMYTESEDLNASIVKLPYMGGKFAMYLIVPYETEGLRPMMAALTPDLLRRVLPTMQMARVNLLLPKFNAQFTTSLRPVLEMLEIRDMFSLKANLSGIAKTSKTNLMVTDVIQKAGLEVNEEGSTAYVTTQADLASKFGDHVEVVKADHPFVFFIEDETTDTVIFVGKVANPVTTELDSRGPQPNEPAYPPPAKPIHVPVTPSYQIQEAISAGGYYGKNGSYVKQNFDQHRFSIFDSELMKHTCESGEMNWVISPASIRTVLGMVYEGAAGDTESQLASALRLSTNKTLGLKQLHSYQRELFEPAELSVDWTTANRVLVSQFLPVVPEFKSAMIHKFRARVDNFDFSVPESTAQQVNGWCANITNGLIPSLLDPAAVNPKTQMVLLNAVYFKGQWLFQFDETQTTESCFYPTPRMCKKVPMMKSQGIYKYGFLKTIYAHVVEIPFADRRFSMVVVMPGNEGGLPDLIKNLPYVSLLSQLNQMQLSEVILSMPRFTAEYSIDLKDTIKKMQAVDMFEDKADLRHMLGQRRGKVDAVIHKAKILVNEKGAEAGAATAGIVVPLMSMKLEIVTVNQPFLFYIRDVQSGFLFAGQISDP